MHNCIQELLNAFEDSAQRVHTIDEIKIEILKREIGVAEKTMNCWAGIENHKSLFGLSVSLLQFLKLRSK